MSLPIPPRPDVATPPTLDDRPGSTWTWWEALGVYLAAFLIAGFATIPIVLAFGSSDPDGGIDGPGIAATLVADAVIFGLLLVWLQRRHREWREAIVPFPDRDAWRHVGAGVIAGLVLLPAVGAVTVALQSVLTDALGREVSAPEQVSSGLSPLAAAAAVLLAVVVAPITEEFFFRGILFRSIRDRHGFWLAALGSAIPFGLVHYTASPWEDNLVLQVAMVFTGVSLAWLYDRRGTLTANVVAHMVFNAVGITLILSSG